MSRRMSSTPSTLTAPAWVQEMEDARTASRRLGGPLKGIIAEPRDEERCDECSGTRYPVEVHDDSCSLSNA